MGKGAEQRRRSGSRPDVDAAARQNLDYLEAMYRQWEADPTSLAEPWRMFFEGFALALGARPCLDVEEARERLQLERLIAAYRSLGHTIARTDPLAEGEPLSHRDLALQEYGFGPDDLERVFDTNGFAGLGRATLRQIVALLQQTYCGSVGVEYMHIQDVRVRRWLEEQMEPVRNRPPLGREEKLALLELLADAELFERFLHSRFPGQKRFSLEGAESLIPALHVMVELAPELGLEEIVMGMTHRGRLNVLANILDRSYATIFSEFEGNYIPGSVAGDADVKYHRGFSSDHVDRRGRSVHISLTPNPSHLEAVSPVVEGRTRAKQRQRGGTTERRKVLPLLIHGDAAFAGQGIVAETLNLSKLEGYRTGGTLHLIIDNQIGFTTSPGEGRSTPYATDVAKMIEAPIFHVNGDDPEAVAHVARLALRFRQTHGRDVVVDLVCYRRHGHNEADEPAFTHPLLYRRIRERPPVHMLYARRLVQEGVLAPAEVEGIERAFSRRLQEGFESMKRARPAPEEQSYERNWRGLDQPYSHARVATGVPFPVLEEVARALCTVPDGFALNPKVARWLPVRLEAVRSRGGKVDWAFAESLAFGSLLHEGIPVRLSGQDTARGTFSQRHAIWYDLRTQEPYIPLRHVRPGQARFCVYNSSLSEAAALGFEYGYAMTEPHMLILWEAQFGDFANGAQVIIDQFIVAGAAKWQRDSGLVLLLPHGYEGQGPEHSNAYLERYLAACAEDNIQVVQPTTPAQYFHVLRRQLARPFRRPLVVMTPKGTLRHPLNVSPVDELIDGAFQEVLDDQEQTAPVQRLVLCSGKLAYDLLAHREQERLQGTAIVRLEQLHPWPAAELARVLAPHRSATDLVWAQEEPQNRGAWAFVAPRLEELLGRKPRYAGRPASASPATGSLRVHRREQEEVVRRALGQG